MIPWLRENYGNPNSVYSLGQRARAAVERAREQIAALLGAADPSEIIFTSGGSESDVLAIAGAAWQAYDETHGQRNTIITTKIEHDAVRLLLGQLRRRGLTVLEVGCGRAGTVNSDECKSMIDDHTAVVSVMHSNNETGVLQPVEELAHPVRPYGALFHTDAVQSVVSKAEILAFQRVVRRLPIADAVTRYAVKLVRASRPGDGAPDFVKQWVSYGASVRAAQALVLGSKARALLQGRASASFEDVRALARPVLRHRILVNFQAQSEKVTTDQLVAKLLDIVPMPKSGI